MLAARRLEGELDQSVLQTGAAALGGVLTPRQTIACAEDLSGIGTSEISLGGPGGRYLYVSSRGPRTVATFYVEEDGLLTAVGETPTGPGNRHFTLDPSGRWMLVVRRLVARGRSGKK